MKRKLYIYQGLPASGKTTKAREVVKNNPDIVRVSRDDLRRMRGTYWIPEQENMITDWEHNAIICALNAGKSVLVDATNLNPKTIRKLEAIVEPRKKDIEIEFVMFDTPLEECIKRDASRPKEEQVGEQVIRDFHNKYLTHKEAPITKIIQNRYLPRAIIVDLDGTLCIHNGRGPFEYNKCDTDLPNENVCNLVADYVYFSRSAGSFVKIFFLSGREDSCKNKTWDWLVNQGLILNSQYPNEMPELLMRKTGDRRKDCIIKKEIFDAHIKDKYYVEFCLDDRDQVVKLWRDMGLTCLQVAEGNF